MNTSDSNIDKDCYKSYLDIALLHANLGLPIFPIDPYTGQSVIKNGPHRESNDTDTVRIWWEHNRNCEVGISIGGYYGIFIVSICCTKEFNGYENLISFEKEYCVLPKTLSIKTPFTELRFYKIPIKYSDVNINTKYYKLGLVLDGDKGFISSPIKPERYLDEYRFENIDNGIIHVPDKLINQIKNNKIPFFTADFSTDAVSDEEYENTTKITTSTSEEIIEAQHCDHIETSSGWENPKDLTNRSKPDSYPIESLPDTIKNAVDEVVSFIQCPIGLAASSALSVISLGVQPYFNVARSTTLISPVSLYFLSIAESGSRKSSGDKMFKQAMLEYEDRKESELTGELLDYQSNIDIWEEQQKALRKNIHTMTMQGKDSSNIEIKLKEHMRKKPKRPPIPKLFYTDFSSEALAKGLYEKWPSAAIMSAEGGAVFGSYGMGKDSIIKTLSLCDQLWDGSQTNFDKVGSGSFTLKDVRLTISLQVQKDVLVDFFNKNKNIVRGSGFLARFLICEQVMTEARIFKEEPSEFKYVNMFKNRIENIIKTDPKITNGRLVFKTINFDNKARNTWICFYNEIENRKIDDGLYSDIRDFASKAAENIARLAALFHIFEHGDGDICEDCVIKAKNIVKWYLNEEKRLFGDMSKFDIKIKKFDDWLKKYCKEKSVTQVGVRTVLQNCHVKKEELNSILPVLQDMHHLRIVDNGKSIEINPKLLSA